MLAAWTDLRNAPLRGFHATTRGPIRDMDAIVNPARRSPMQRTGDIPRKAERLQEYFRRLSNATPAASFDQGYQMLCEIMTRVENELTGLPDDPTRWKEIDRMFPPGMDCMRSIPDSAVKAFDHLRHVTYIASNGAIEIRKRRSIETKFSKRGSDGRSVVDVCPQLRVKNL